MTWTCTTPTSAPEGYRVTGWEALEALNHPWGEDYTIRHVQPGIANQVIALVDHAPSNELYLGLLQPTYSDMEALDEQLAPWLVLGDLVQVDDAFVGGEMTVSWDSPPVPYVDGSTYRAGFIILRSGQDYLVRLDDPADLSSHSVIAVPGHPLLGPDQMVFSEDDYAYPTYSRVISGYDYDGVELWSMTTPYAEFIDAPIADLRVRPLAAGDGQTWIGLNEHTQTTDTRSQSISRGSPTTIEEGVQQWTFTVNWDLLPDGADGYRFRLTFQNYYPSGPWTIDYQVTSDWGINDTWSEQIGPYGVVTREYSYPTKPANGTVTVTVDDSNILYDWSSLTSANIIADYTFSDVNEDTLMLYDGDTLLGTAPLPDGLTSLDFDGDYNIRAIPLPGGTRWALAVNPSCGGDTG